MGGWRKLDVGQRRRRSVGVDVGDRSIDNETSTPVVADVTDVLFRGAFLFFFFYWRLSNETSRKLAPFLIFYFIANGRS